MTTPFQLVLLVFLIAPIAVVAEASSAGVNRMMALDRNDDGVLTEDESPPGMFSLLDTNDDGVIVRSEVAEFMAKVGRPFSWVNAPESARAHPRRSHSTFLSPTMKVSVGFNIYLPPGYEQPENSNKRYPVIYYLHGGRPGNESLTIDLVAEIDTAVTTGVVRPMIFVWANGGRVSHYNYGDSLGEDVFVKELIPHIDRTYRTIATRGGRALQGFSQGGRGTTRIMFKYPELFVSAAPGSPGYAVEKLILESGGVEQDPRVGANAPALDFGKGNDAYSLAKTYLNGRYDDLAVMIWVGTKDFNYAATLEYFGYLYALDISAERLIAPDVDHNPLKFYNAHGVKLLQFHDRHWRF
ncbi:MAG: 1,4-beta-xylanase [Pseudomonadales bacterium]|nr:1,4-beta-xylanase [Pseudomonadales bacterium]